MSYLYVISCNNEFYKVGIATDVAARVASLQTGNPYPLEVCAYYEFDNASPVEQSVHQRFSTKWQSGEWYRLDADDLSILEQICTLLGGARELKPIEVDEPAADEEEAVSPKSVDEMLEDGWRIEVTRGGKYFNWRRGRMGRREGKYGGYFTDLPKERQEEYLRNKARANGNTEREEPTQ